MYLEGVTNCRKKLNLPVVYWVQVAAAPLWRVCHSPRETTVSSQDLVVETPAGLVREGV